MASNGKGASCIYCERVLEATTSLSSTAATRDHLHPRSRGGTLKDWCCKACNGIKGDMLLEDWRAFMQANPKWWKLDVRNAHPPIKGRKP